MCGRAYGPRFLWMWPNARISVMGGQQAASVLLTVRLDNLRSRGGDMTPDEQEAFMRPTIEKYEAEGSAYYSTRASGTTASSTPPPPARPAPRRH